MEFRTIEPDEVDDFLLSVSHAFSESTLDDFDALRDKQRLEADRCFVAIDEGKIVGCTGVYSWLTTVPGGAGVPTSGVTTVGVLPTHRRKGILRELMKRTLDQSAERGEALSTLFASQGAIYHRFGFGLSTRGLEFDVATRGSGFLPWFERSGTVRLLSHDDALEPITKVYRAEAPRRPGMIQLSEKDVAWLMTEPKKTEEKPFYAVHFDDDGNPDAFATYKSKHDWPQGLPQVELKVTQMIANTSEGAANIWRFLLDVDLVHNVVTWTRPVDDPLQYLLAEPRVMRAKLYDEMWGRPVDVAVALEARTYDADGRVVVEVHDATLPANDGTYELTAESGKGSCAKVDAEPDLVCPVNAVGAAYFGGTSWRSLAAAGMVTERTPGALATADAMFASYPAPWASFTF